MPTLEPSDATESEPSPESPPASEVAAAETPNVEVQTIKLDSFLKFVGAVGTGGAAKMRIKAGEVQVNSEVELRRGRKLRAGDVVDIDDDSYIVEWGAAEESPS